MLLGVEDFLYELCGDVENPATQKSQCDTYVLTSVIISFWLVGGIYWFYT